MKSVGSGHVLKRSLLGVSLLAAASCTQPGETTGVSAAAGGVLGAGLGAMIGSHTGSTGSGVAIGAVAGAATGALVGNSIEAQQETVRTQDEAIERQQQIIAANRRELEALKGVQRDVPQSPGRGRYSNYVFPKSYQPPTVRASAHHGRLSSASLSTASSTQLSSSAAASSGVSSQSRSSVESRSAVKAPVVRAGTEIPTRYQAPERARATSTEWRDFPPAKSGPARVAMVPAPSKAPVKRSIPKDPVKTRSSDTVEAVDESVKGRAAAVKPSFAETTVKSDGVVERDLPVSVPAQEPESTTAKVNEALTVIDSGSEEKLPVVADEEVGGIAVETAKGEEGTTAIALSEEVSIDKKPEEVTGAVIGSSAIVPARQESAVSETAALSDECRKAAVEEQKAVASSEVSDKLFHYRRAIRLCPTSAAYHNSLGEVYRSLNRTVDAEAEFREALRLSPSLEAARRNLEGN